MCELLGMSANVPTDICFSFSGLRARGGRTGPHKDGWGMAMYRDGDVWAIHDPRPSADSDMAEVMSHTSLKCDIVISHIRQANVGAVCLLNTHPFSRLLWGKTWSYAHNGQLEAAEALVIDKTHPLGSTDSERAFCWIIEQLQRRFDNLEPEVESLSQALSELALQLKERGVFNMMLSDGKRLYCFCTTKLHWITRRAPFQKASLSDEDVIVDFQAVTTDKDVVTVIATQPLTQDESWQQMQEGELCVFDGGEVVCQIKHSSSVA
ncbi:class II glutamine amidotransferase [Marinomonas posidonica]|uniref:Glutamine amidotransferase class-II n=1 Tax=Marinomonas posidonica (strain CECT 7376 / NCIMB 14433 / IVIA-Po-181) TaxID=491952 RepID=F6CYG1_MARPP|nr:class II glutamine amidotransferase [Marinomonas posidonica]AEF54570.1 glutamine amidotransferase class-II [Marinomonas posidonica IVIA-Po-181]